MLMVRIKPPETIKDFLKIKNSILELIDNPYCDSGMRAKMIIKLAQVKTKIQELKKKNDVINKSSDISGIIIMAFVN